MSMTRSSIRLTYIGGPTALIEFGGLRFVTDPTFDAAPAEYHNGSSTLRKRKGPALSPDALGHVDAVLLSHDHHWDNLDRSGRDFLARVDQVITTKDGAKRLGGNAIGLEPWQTVDVRSGDGRTLRVTATPARHGPSHMDRGPVIGFVFQYLDDPSNVIYFGGDTVWYEGVEEVAKRFSVTAAILNLGAAQVEPVGPFHLTMTAQEAVEAATVFPRARIVPLHYEGWEHFSESRVDIDRAFVKAGMRERLQWLEPGRAIEIADRAAAA